MASMSRDSLLVFVPHECPHGTVHIIREPCKAQPVAINTQTLKTAVPLITHRGKMCSDVNVLARLALQAGLAQPATNESPS